MSTTEQTRSSGPYTGDGTTVSFLYGYHIKENTDIVVTVDGVEQTLTTHYTVTGVDNGSGGTVEFVSAPASGAIVRTFGRTVAKQNLQLLPGGGIDAKADQVEDQLDRSAHMAAESRQEAQAAIRVPTGETPSGIPQDAAGRANKALTFDASGNPVAETDAGDIASAGANATAAAASATAAGTAQTAAEAAQTAAETAETNAGTQASNAAASAAAAALALASAGFRYNYSSTTTDADPGAGNFRLNNATLASVTEIYIDNQDLDSNDLSLLLSSWDDYGEATARGLLTVKGNTSASDFAYFLVTGSVTDGTGYRKLTVTYISSGGAFDDGDDFVLSFAPAGADGSNDIVADTTPQIGGDLDVNGHAIVSVSNGNIPITPNGTGRILLTSPNLILGSDARGDMFFRGAANLERLAKGTTGQVLTMGADDPAWADASGGDATLDDTTFSGEAQYNFTSFDATKYYAYSFELLNVVPSSDNVNLRGRTSEDGGSTYDDGTNFYGDASLAAAAATRTFMNFWLNVGSSSFEDGISGFIYCIAPHLAKRTQFPFWGAFTTNANNPGYSVGMGHRRASVAIDGFRLYWSAGSFESGRIVAKGLSA
ncbi:MAG: hypothetical protein AAF661_05045 [Pseudomonadota bacterium]